MVVMWIVGVLMGEKPIFFVHILTYVIYHYIDICKVFIAGLCKLADGENAHCDGLEGHSFYLCALKLCFDVFSCIISEI
jgi:hypothetical protein